jgi:hypothetical protein
MIFHKPPNNDDFFPNNVIHDIQPGFNLNKKND